MITQVKKLSMEVALYCTQTVPQATITKSKDVQTIWVPERCETSTEPEEGTELNPELRKKQFPRKQEAYHKQTNSLINSAPGEDLWFQRHMHPLFQFRTDPSVRPQLWTHPQKGSNQHFGRSMEISDAQERIEESECRRSGSEQQTSLPRRLSKQTQQTMQATNSSGLVNRPWSDFNLVSKDLPWHLPEKI